MNLEVQRSEKIETLLGAFVGSVPAEMLSSTIEAMRFQPISTLDLSARAYFALRAENIQTLGDLIVLSESDLLRLPNLGRKSLNEVEASLAQKGLSLGTKLPLLATDSIDKLNLADETMQLLKEAQMETVGDITSKSSKAIQKMLGDNAKAKIQEIEHVLTKSGLKFGSKKKDANESSIGLSADPINGYSEQVYGEILTAGAVVNFPSAWLAATFVEKARPLVGDHLDNGAYHLKCLPTQNPVQGKFYPVYVSDDALDKLTNPENISKLSILKQDIGMNMQRS